jgi:simple sugar transport system permease protein
MKKAIYLTLIGVALSQLQGCAAVVVGGAAITGGRGTIPGTILGVLLIQVINRALILTGIPVEWQRWVVGVILILFTSIPALRARRAKRIGHTTELTETDAAE